MGRELETLPDYYVRRKLLCGQRERNEFSSTPSGSPEYKGGEEKELLEVLDAASNIVIVEGKPGVGKSKMLSDVAKQLKDRDHASWILRVNLWEFDTVLEHSGDSAVEDILNATLANKDELGRLEYALLESRKVVCLVDGFDEVDPEFEDNCLVVLYLLAKRRKGKLVVTTRPGQVKLLEDRLRVRAHSLEPFSDAELREFLTHHIPGAYFTENRFIGIDLMNLLRIPLFAEMYASVAEGATEATKTYNIVTLYEAFIRKDFMRLYKEQRRESLSAKGKKKEVEGLLKVHEEQLMILAESTLVRREDLPPMPKFSMTFMKPGIVYELPDGKPAFLHRSFAEYFLAKRLAFGGRERSYVAKVYCKAYRDRTLELFLKFFNRMVADGQKLLEAVLDYDLEKFLALLREGVDPRQADTYDRNVLHLSCDSGIPVPVLCRNYSSDELKDLLSARDCLLGWTPLRYAAECGDWFIVYWLVMVADCDPSLLGEDFAAQLDDPTQLQALFEREGYRSLYQHVIRVNDSSSHRTENSVQIQVAVSLMSADMPEESVELIAKKALEEGHDAVGNLLLLIYCGKPIQDVRPVLAMMRNNSLSRKLEEYGWRGWGETAEPAGTSGSHDTPAGGRGLLTQETEALFGQESTEELRNWIHLHFSSWASQRSQELESTSADKILEELLNSVEIPMNFTIDFWIRGFFVELLVEMDVQKKRFRRSPNSALQ